MTARLRYLAGWGAGLSLAGLALPTVAVVCGMGWLYLLRSAQLLAIGPRVRGGLALEQLASGDAQPLLRLLAAWALAGLASGAVLGATAGRRARRLLPPFALGSAVALVAVGATSDAVANNDVFLGQIVGQLSVPASALALVTLIVASIGGVIAAHASHRARAAFAPVAHARIASPAHVRGAGDKGR